MMTVETIEISALLKRNVIKGAEANPSRKFWNVQEPLKENKFSSNISDEGKNAAFQDQSRGTAVKPVIRIKKK
jgi:hypothetical protein